MFDNNLEGENFGAVFRECRSLINVDVDILKNNLKTTYADAMLRGTLITEVVKINHLTLLRSINQLYLNCRGLANIPFDYLSGLSNLKTANLTFYGMTNIALDNTGYGIFELPSTFLDGCDSLEDIGEWTSVSKVIIDPTNLLLPTTIKNVNRIFAVKSVRGLRGDYVPNIFEGNTNSINIGDFAKNQSEFYGVFYRFWRDSNLTLTNNANAFSGCINALNYPEIPISWGGTIASSRLGFWIDTYKYDSVGKMFSTSPSTWLVHDGDEENPDIGDTVYLDYDLSSNIYDGDEKYFAISQDLSNNEQGTHWIQVDDDGLIIDKGVISIETDFVMEVVIPNNGDVFKIKQKANKVYSLEGGENATIDWGDGSSLQLTDLNYNIDQPTIEKTYSNSGTYQVKISGRLSQVNIGDENDGGGRIKRILQWGDLGTISYSLFSLYNLEELPQGAVTGLVFSKKGTRYNSEDSYTGLSLNIAEANILENIPSEFTSLLKYEDIGLSVIMNNFGKDFYKLKAIPDDIFLGLSLIQGTDYMFKNLYDLEYLPKDLFNNAYFNAEGFGRDCLIYSGKNYLGDPNKTLVLDENFFSNIRLSEGSGAITFKIKGWNIDSVPQNLLRNSLSSIENGGTGEINTTELFRDCSKLTSLPDNLFKDFQVTSMNNAIRGTSITHVKSSWMGGTVQNNDNSFNEFARSGIVDTIDEDFFDYFPNTTSLRIAFGGNELVTFSDNTFRDLPKLDSFQQTFSNNPLTSIPQDAFKESINVTTMSGMFSNTPIVNIPDDLFKDFTEVVNASSIFFQCEGLVSIPVGLFNDMIKNETFYRTFYRCRSLTLIPIGYFSYNVSVDTFEGCFEDSGIIQVPDGLFDNTEIATNFKQTFKGCESLDFVPADVFDNNVEALTFRSCFEDCEALVGNINFTINRCTKVTDISRMFYDSANADPAFELSISFLPIPNVIERADYFSVLADPHLHLLPGMFENATNIEYALTSSSGNFSVYTEVPNILRDNLNAVNVRGMMQNHETLTGFIYRFWRDSLLTFSEVTGAFSGCVNALNYPEVPVAWGGLGSPRLGFWMDINGEPTSADVVNGNENSWLIHDGANEEPEIGDTVYTSYDTNAGTILGANQFYAIKTDKWIQIDPNGVIIDKGDDTTPPGDLEVINFGVAYPIQNGVALACNRSNGVGTVTQQISYREVGTGSFIPGVSTTQRLTIMEQSGLIPGVTYEFQLTVTDDNETALSSVVTSTIQ